MTSVFTMTATLSVLLCLGRPYLSASKGPLVPLGSSVTLRCGGSQWAKSYLLEKEQESGTIKIIKEKPARGEVEFLIPSVKAKRAGKYYCCSRHSSVLSECSNPLELVVTGLHDPPTLSALPSSQVTFGQQVTLQCHSEQWYGMFTLYKDGKEIERQRAQPHERGAQTNFSVWAVSPAHGETYQCYSYHSDNPFMWSAPSDPLVLRVTVPGTTKEPHLTQSPEKPQNMTSSSPKISPTSKSGHTLLGLSFPQAGILIGIPVFFILLMLFLLFLWHRHRQHKTKLRNGGQEAEAKATRRSDPDGTPLEETMYEDVGEDRHIEEARAEDLVAPPGEDPQDVTYAQLNLNSPKVGVKDLPTSGSEDPSVYATLR
ncbi:platelet glycoprotein VI-like isoform X2 [Macrotis lagotis]|uniref:platelet glycoprotein VI-like isoform X2 n=1 Tax=Macrotis lagotis TaxID=92651 RepID=UPI003D68F106